MTKETRRIHFDEFAARLPALFEAMARENQTVLVEKEGKLFRVEPTTEDQARHVELTRDPKDVRAVLRKTAGAFTGLDRREFMTDIHAARQQVSRGRPA